MNYEEILLTKTDDTFYRFYKLLDSTEPDTYTVNELARRAGLSYQKTYNMVQAINRQVQQFSTEQQRILTPHGGIDTRQLKVSLDWYRFQLISRNLPYKILYYLLTNPAPTLENFSQTLNISQSTIFRKLKPLTQFLKRFNVRLHYKTLSLTGDERYIRLVLYYIFHLAARHQSIQIFPEALQQRVQAVQALANEKIRLFTEVRERLDMDMVTAVFLLRQDQGHFVPDDPRYNVLLDDNPNYQMDVLKALQPATLSADDLIGELHFGFFVLNYPPLFRDADSAFLQQHLAYFQRQNNLIWRFCTDLLAAVQHACFNDRVNLAQDRVLFGNLLNAALGYYVLQGPFMLLQEENSDGVFKAYGKNQLYRAIDCYFAQLPPAFRAFRKVAPALTKAIYLLLIRQYIGNNPQFQLRIGLDIHASNYIYQDFAEFLDGMPYFKVHPYTSEQAAHDDVVITTSASLYRQNLATQRYFFFTLDDPASFVALYAKLYQYYGKHIMTLRRMQTLPFTDEELAELY
ncbi:helix-turn-helix domain-containing protein [Loigolactobacillus bifermentans]|uniref:Mga helix-turn-helix domain-containing protein n=1 Tax=Loigolactobacillus bifermentans DSM 20003 TaxID=1423726 RepID=A0A0R1GKR1_9LACO|nr:helix-turn-helix domain-containing protein [Loigolactobacillus bifermentans]KRK34677.1 hypothetical protein FC07_GL000431 [Loigolactobacillus bifermentans DSM 20003]QGG61058.1 hypothetical protein LB003_11625 [Loigolactobacillus bifermentans]